MLTIDVITGSRGGIGKTLWSLLLANYYRQNTNREKVALIDLNNVNSDVKWMCHRQLMSATHATNIPIYPKSKDDGASKRIPEKDSNEENRRKTANVIIRKPTDFSSTYLGVMSDPYHHLTPTSFNRFLGELVTGRDGAFPGCNRIIIDTNYHPCHLFSVKNLGVLRRKASDRDPVRLRIWFLWSPRILRQMLLNAIDTKFIFSDEITTLHKTIDSIEKHFTYKDVESNSVKRSPVFHLLPGVAFDCLDSLKNLNRSYLANSKNDSGITVNSLAIENIIEAAARDLGLVPSDVLENDSAAVYGKVISYIADMYREEGRRTNFLSYPEIDPRLKHYALKAHKAENPLDFIATHKGICATAKKILDIADRI